MSESLLALAASLVFAYAVLLGCYYDAADAAQSGFGAAVLAIWLAIQAHERTQR